MYQNIDLLHEENQPKISANPGYKVVKDFSPIKEKINTKHTF